ncbi:MAG: hypothetical protein HC802_07800 [Caldilineaceae bacterium]|nr:hypothetical protein [Caldilineaceae bacterium]
MTIQVETVFQAPGPQPNGMQATAEGLWILDQITNQVHLVSYAGKVLRTLETASNKGSGITDDGDALWLTSTYSREILKIDRNTGETLASFPSPDPSATGAHGLEWHAGKLWVANPPSATIYQVDVSHGFEIVHRFPAPATAPTASPGMATTSGASRPICAASSTSIRPTVRSSARSICLNHCQSRMA